MTPHTTPRRPPAPKRAIVATCLAFLVAMMGTTIPTPLYSIYAAELAFSPLTVTVLFAAYAIGVVAALACFGRLSDEIGRRPVLMIAVATALASALLFLLPPSLPLLIIARVVSGLGAGLMSGTGTAALMDLFPAERRATAGALSVGVNTGGLALGTLVAGIIAETAARPLVTPFVVHLELCALALALLALWSPRRPSGLPVRPAPFVTVGPDSSQGTHDQRDQRGGRSERPRIRPQRLRVPPELRGAFTRAVLGAGAGFATTGVLTAVTAIFLARDLRLESHALAGFVVFLAFGCMALGQLFARLLNPRVALPAGCAGLVVAAVLLATALATATLTPLLAAAVTLGLAAGVCLNAGITSLVNQSPPERRGEVSSAYFAGLYVMLAIPAVGVGVLASIIGLREAGLVFCAVVALLAVAVGVAQLRSSRA